MLSTLHRQSLCLTAVTFLMILYGTLSAMSPASGTRWLTDIRQWYSEASQTAEAGAAANCDWIEDQGW